MLVSQTNEGPSPGSDEIDRAYEDAWIDNRSLAFLGDVLSEQGEQVTELFIVELPDDLTIPGERPLAGTRIPYLLRQREPCSGVSLIQPIASIPVFKDLVIGREVLRLAVASRS